MSIHNLINSLDQENILILPISWELNATRQVNCHCVARTFQTHLTNRNVLPRGSLKWIINTYIETLNNNNINHIIIRFIQQIETLYNILETQTNNREYVVIKIQCNIFLATINPCCYHALMILISKCRAHKFTNKYI